MIANQQNMIARQQDIVTKFEVDSELRRKVSEIEQTFKTDIDKFLYLPYRKLNVLKTLLDYHEEVALVKLASLFENDKIKQEEFEKPLRATIEDKK